MKWNARRISISAARASRRPLTWIAAAFVLAPAVAAIASERLPADLAPNIVEGQLRAAECVATAQAPEGCDPAALRQGKPGGIMAGGRFTVLLVDARALARTCAAEAGRNGHLRASGIVHAGGAAMTVFQLEEDCGSGARVVDLPYSGVVGSGAEGGDE